MTLLTIYILSTVFCLGFFRREFYEAMASKKINKTTLMVLVGVLLTPVLNSVLAFMILAIIVYDITESARVFRRKG